MTGYNIGAIYATLGVDATGVVNAQKAMINLQRQTITSVNQMKASITGLQGSISKLQAQMGAQKGMTAMATTTKASIGQFDKLQTVLQRTAMGLRSFGWLATTVLTAPLLMAGKASVQAYSDFEYSMMKIVGLVGIARSTVEEWSKSILAMGKEVGASPIALADALYYVTSSGFKTAEALYIVEESAKASAAGLGEVKDVADLVTSVMNAYGQGNITAARTLDILTAAVREGKGEALSMQKC